MYNVYHLACVQTWVKYHPLTQAGVQFGNRGMAQDGTNICNSDDLEHYLQADPVNHLSWPDSNP